ncbi:LLM class flavin-dependent oxidoreductase [Nonomuraea sp. KC401]|uniref:MupA/Atu3671 family FMN-dependent luciferase-like monooxygenase n=1 Tax=unclassified Nonomuraea TaxID=2593643 RepID=UPI0010FD6A36|nr:MULTISPECIES: MupA/Atu3671 family FMN-dependent luciferase-like monooxygenase [unclassified Nonomuraea]NBE97997.1 LLM class flavin-dependent oxidoreductase [Nonomuraea sp. K271]TLF61827.1 LLM class flavin-dependent oxidoreductase [Nonomuraea sp. KC401]
MTSRNETATERLNRLREQLAGSGEPEPERAREDSVPLSFPQRRLWFLEQMSPGSAAYHLPSVVRLSGDLDREALAAALAAVVARHDVLRAVVLPGDGEPRQRFLDRVEVPLPFVELRDEAGAAIDAHVAAFLRLPFELERGPLLRAKLFGLGEREHVLVVCLHHLVADGWSVNLFWEELCAAYRAAVHGDRADDAPSAGYADFVEAGRERLAGAAGEEDLAYWRGQLAGAPALLPLPTDRPRPPVRANIGGETPVTLPAPVVASLREVGASVGASLYMVLLALYAAELHRYTGETDLLVGSPAANRGRAEFERVIGYFADTLVMRLSTEPHTTFRRLVAEVREVVLDAVTHQAVPFERIVEELRPERDVSHHPVFQVLFSLHNLPEGRIDMGEVRLEFLRHDLGVSRYDLDLSLTERNGRISGRLEYNAELFEPGSARRIATHFECLAAAAAADPDAPIGALAMSTDGDRRQVLDWGTTAPAAGELRLVHDLIAEQARRSPDACAVECLGTRLTYRELDRRADELAGLLRAHGAGPGHVVGVLLARSAELVAALVAVLRAGAAYLPLDPGHPADRLRDLVAGSGAESVLTSRSLSRRLPPGVTALRVDDLPTLRADPVRVPVAAGDLAYVMYTSGSTGRPKGVLVTHGNLSAFLDAMDETVPEPDGAGRRWLAVTGVSFDISVLELLWTLTCGFEVVIHAGGTGGSQPRSGLDVSLFYFGNHGTADGYRLLLDGARFADRNGFAAVWTPERHFHEFGGLFPQPAVTSAAIASVTTRVAIRAGSVVLPLHDPIRVAEQWAVLDRLSDGRVGLSAASGWHPTDFALDPASFDRRREVMRERLETVRALWRGGTVRRRTGTRGDAEVRTHPRPVQDDLPLWLTTGGSRGTFELAGELGANVLTHLLGQDKEQLRAHIAAYRAARAAHGHDPGAGRVTLMLHTYVGDDVDEIRRTMREPFLRYLRTSFGLMGNLLAAMGQDRAAADSLTEEDVDFLMSQAFDRFFEHSGLIGTPESCAARARELHDLGVDELACLIDMGLPYESVIAGLPALAEAAQEARLQIARAAQPSVARLIEERGITHVQLTPSLLASELVESRDWSGVVALLVGGEEFPSALAAQARERVGGPVMNMYGPTETTIWSAAQRLEAGEGAVPIGRPLSGERVHVLEPSGAPAPPGVMGEIYIGGEGVARGYLEAPGLTAERFVPDLFGPPGARLYRTGDRGYWADDGTLRFAGRADDQVKVRGFRIEPREVETRLRELDGIAEAAVVPHAGGLAAHLVLHPGRPFDPDAVRAGLRRVLPAYMVPGVIAQTGELPRTPGGKLDRRALGAVPPPGTTGSPTGTPQPGRPPRTAQERALAAIWCEVLGRSAVGVGDDFFALGGHSLMAVQMATAVRARMGLALPLRAVFEAPTLGELARAIQTGRFAAQVPAAAPELAADAELSPGIRPRTAPWGPPRQALVTGATGFLGRVLLGELLDRTEAVAHCLVLASDDAAAGKEIEDALRAADLWRPEYAARIVPIAGNLADPCFGLGQPAFARLAELVDTVYHAGAMVHLLYPYSVLKGPNVDGTAEVLRLTATGRAKRLHHVSSLDVFPDGVPRREDAPIAADGLLPGAYAQSKWVAERLVGAAFLRGLAGTVLRPGNLAADTRTGYWNSHDTTFTLLRTCLRLGAAPDLDLVVNLTPVDYAAAAIVRLSLDEGATGGAFHLFNPHPHVPWRDVVESLRAAGHQMDLVPYDRWQRGDLPAGPAPEGLLDELALVGESGGLAETARHGARLEHLRIDCSATLSALTGTGIACPPVDRRLLATYVAHWHRRGLIPAPGQR